MEKPKTLHFPMENIREDLFILDTLKFLRYNTESIILKGNLLRQFLLNKSPQNQKEAKNLGLQVPLTNTHELEL